MTFKDFMRNCDAGQDMRGDFLRDARADRQFPEVQTWRELESYLLRCGACEEARKAGRALWREFRALARTATA